jgi:leucyl/phenylalanyl-tRNA--protein transferase
VLWWSPDPRAVLFPEEFSCSRSLAKTIRNGGFEVVIDRDFAAVLDACAAPRPHAPGTWITSEMRSAYLRLHRLGQAHSFETWRDGKLAGGLYGVRLGEVFFGESMFSRERDASKVALAHLVAVCLRNSIAVIDCQLPSPHLEASGRARSRGCNFRHYCENTFRWIQPRCTSLTAKGRAALHCLKLHWGVLYAEFAPLKPKGPYV